MSSSAAITSDSNINPDQSDSITPSISDSGKPKCRCGNDPCTCFTSKWEARLRKPIQAKKENPSSSRSRKSSSKSMKDYVKDWVDKKIELGVPESKYFLPFLDGASKLADCRLCQKVIFPREKVLCSVQDCECAYHLKCAIDSKLTSTSSTEFKCPQHACYLCKQKHRVWRCARCHLSWHDKCAAFPEHVVQLEDKPGQAICWRHSTDWPPEKVTSSFRHQNAVPIKETEEILHRLPIPYVMEEFKIDQSLKEISTNTTEPPLYIHIRRNIYLVKKKHNDSDRDSGCKCSNTCADNCVCRFQFVSCSKNCSCSDACTNKPFRKDKKVKVVETEFCGWGVQAAESIEEGDFIMEYIGEVISDAMCEERLWDMKKQGIQKFYMCEVRKDFTIDATYKGNSSRFLNHSCEPNCILEKWQVEGETRLGLFATQDIKVGEALTYDYKFVQFGPEVECLCGTAECGGKLGTKKKMTAEEEIDKGTQRPRSRSANRANQ